MPNSPNPLPPGERQDVITYRVVDRLGAIRTSGATEEKARSVISRLVDDVDHDAPFTLQRTTYVSFTSREDVEVVEAGAIEAPTMESRVTKAAERLRQHWHDFTQCDWFENGFAEAMEAAGLVEWRSVEAEDLEQSFASELGIVPGGTVWVLTPAGRASLQADGEPR